MSRRACEARGSRPGLALVARIEAGALPPDHLKRLGSRGGRTRAARQLIREAIDEARRTMND